MEARAAIRIIRRSPQLKPGIHQQKRRAYLFCASPTPGLEWAVFAETKRRLFRFREIA